MEHGWIGLPGGFTPDLLIETAARHGARNVRRVRVGGALTVVERERTRQRQFPS